MTEASEIILVHGWMGEPDDWTNFSERLPSCFKTRRICLPGHGERSHEEIPEWTRLIQDLAEDVTSLTPHRKLWLVGYSLGGRICLELAAQHPDSFAGLILLGSRPGWPLNTAIDERKKADEKWSADIRDDFPAMLHRWYQQELFADLSAFPDFSTLIMRRQNQDPERMAESLCRWSPVHQADRIGFLQNLNRPRLWISGGQDKVYSDLGLELNAQGCFTEIIEIPHAGHALLWQNPEACAESMTDFIEKQKE